MPYPRLPSLPMSRLAGLVAAVAPYVAPANPAGLVVASGTATVEWLLAGGAKKHGGIVRSWIDDEDGSPSPRLFPGFLKEDKKRPEWSAVVASAKERADRQQEQEARPRERRRRGRLAPRGWSLGRQVVARAPRRAPRCL